jgi:hypothetical protein
MKDNNFSLKLIGYIFYIAYNTYFYNIINNIKKYEDCLQKNKCQIIYNSKKITLLRYINSFFILLGIFNLVIPFNKYFIKIPLLGGIYSFILLTLLSLQFTILSNIFSKLDKHNCFKCLKIKNIRLFKLLLKTKFKTILITIIISYLILIYL